MDRRAYVRVARRAGVAGKPRARLLSWGAVAAWAVLIFVLSSIPDATMPNVGPPRSLLDTITTKGAHIVLYAVLAVLLRRALSGGRGAWWRAWLLAVVYGISDEWHQSYTPGREARLIDGLIDAVGAGLGLVLLPWAWTTWSAWRSRRRTALLPPGGRRPRPLSPWAPRK